jgi:hypothetical protein
MRTADSGSTPFGIVHRLEDSPVGIVHSLEDSPVGFVHSLEDGLVGTNPLSMIEATASRIERSAEMYLRYFDTGHSLHRTNGLKPEL